MDMSKNSTLANIPQITVETGRIQLQGNEVLNFGLGWDAAAEDGSLKGRGRKMFKRATGEANDSDADAFAVGYTRNKPIAFAGLDSLNPWHGREGDGSMTSEGDAKTGNEVADGDDETLTIRLASLPQRVDKILITCGAFKKGSDQRKIRNMIATIYNSTDGQKTPMAFSEPSLLRPKHMMAIGVLEKDNGVWYFRALDESFDIVQGDMDSLLERSVAVASRAI